MQRILSGLAAFVGGTLGWWLGAHVGLMTAFLAGMAGTGLGMYWARGLV